ncbi:hypothetical protein [Yokenella regensburgei]|uniref:hypothetical protein n=1 Tax=Yokenella regensburgei TaxID=158877 RepID=UPI003EDA98F4
MSRMTFVVEFPDGQEPSVSAGINVLGGTLISATFSDLTEGCNLITVARLSLQCGVHWREILNQLIMANGWKEKIIGVNNPSWVIIVPPEQVDDVLALVRFLVPVTIRIDVKAGPV